LPVLLDRHDWVRTTIRSLPLLARKMASIINTTIVDKEA